MTLPAGTTLQLARTTDADLLLRLFIREMEFEQEEDRLKAELPTRGPTTLRLTTPLKLATPSYIHARDLREAELIRALRHSATNP